MHFAKFIHTEPGRVMLSAILGLGLATMFRRTCNKKNCLVFSGPVIQEFTDRVYKYDGKCYKYAVEESQCMSHKRTLPISQ